MAFGATGATSGGAVGVDIAGLIHSYGYAAVGLGAFLEGETVVLAGGAAAFHGYLALHAVIAVAALASFLGDQAFFCLGRRYGTLLTARFASLQPRAARVSALLERHHVPLILAVRFMYGLRIAGPVAIGMSKVHWRRFFALNLTGAVAWASIVAGLGYGLGQGLAVALGSFDRDEMWLLAALLLPAALWWVARHAARSVRRTGR